MSPIYHCPWCIVTERGTRAPALVRKHILEVHRAVLIRTLGLIESFGTRKTLDPPRNAANPRRPLNPGVSGEGDT